VSPLGRFVAQHIEAAVVQQRCAVRAEGEHKVAEVVQVLPTQRG
jgi:hypothetical protein